MLTPQFSIKAKEEKKDYSKFIFEPLEPGYGQTLGNALRRCLLDSLPGAAVVAVQIDGVKHQFSSLEGMKEDVVEMILNIKELRIKYFGEDEIKLKIDAVGPGKVKAGDIKLPAGVEIVNKDLILANLADKKSRLKMEMRVSVGIGYSPAEERKITSVGMIPLDAAFSPVRRVSYKVKSTRVGRRTDLDKLVMEIWTDGTITPNNALKDVAKTLVKYFKQVYDPVIVKTKKKEPASFIFQETQSLTVEELDLPTRIANALRKGGYKTVKDLQNAKESQVSKVKNLGDKSVKLVIKALKDRGIELAS